VRDAYESSLESIWLIAITTRCLARTVRRRVAAVAAKNKDRMTFFGALSYAGIDFFMKTREEES